MERGEAKERICCDYIGAMTDRFAIAQYEGNLYSQVLDGEVINGFRF